MLGKGEGAQKCDGYRHEAVAVKAKQDVLSVCSKAKCYMARQSMQACGGRHAVAGRQGSAAAGKAGSSSRKAKSLPCMQPASKSAVCSKRVCKTMQCVSSLKKVSSLMRDLSSRQQSEGSKQCVQHKNAHIERTSTNSLKIKMKQQNKQTNQTTTTTRIRNRRNEAHVFMGLMDEGAACLAMAMAMCLFQVRQKGASVAGTVGVGNGQGTGKVWVGSGKGRGKGKVQQ